MTDHDDTANQANHEPTSRDPKEIIADFRDLTKRYHNLAPEEQALIDAAISAAEWATKSRRLRERATELTAYATRTPRRIGNSTNPEGELLYNFPPGRKPQPYTSSYPPGGDTSLGIIPEKYHPMPEIADWFNKPVGNEPPDGSNFGISKGFDEQPPNSQIVPPADTASGETGENPEN